jgi:hypothetical protein
MAPPRLIIPMVYREKPAIAFDPGGTSGVALHLGNDYRTAAVQDQDEVWEYLKMGPFVAVIFETFAAQLISGYGLHTVEIVGGIRAVCKVMGWPAQPHPPSRRKAFLEAAADILDKMGREYVIHEQDALAHLLAWEYHDMKTRGVIA